MIRKRPLLLALVTLFPFVVYAQQGKWAAPDDPTAKYIIDSERRWAEAACDNNLVAKTILADDFQGTSPEGKRYDKAEEVNDARHPTRKYRDCKLGEVKVRFFGENVALVYGSESRVRTDRGKDEPETLVWTDTWLKRGGKWQIVAAEDLLAHAK